MRDDSIRLQDIVEAIERIERYAGIDKSAFERDELVQTWMVYNVQIIGEAAANISEELRAMHPEIPWRSIASMRNVVIHAYFKVDLDEVWNVVQNDLPVLKERIGKLISETSGESA